MGDSRKMAEIPNESVHLIITSPPYWQLKDYGNERQIGFHDSYEEYINNLNLVWNEWNQYFPDHWTFPSEKADKHLAMFLEGGITA